MIISQHKKIFEDIFDIILKLICNSTWNTSTVKKTLNLRMRKRHIVILSFGWIIHANSHGGKESYAYYFV